MFARVQRPLWRASGSIRFARSYAYPKEGLFQPDSPPRDIPGFGPAPPMGQYQPAQQTPGVPQHQIPPIPQQQPQSRPASGPFRRPLILRLIWAGSLVYCALIGTSLIDAAFARPGVLEPGSEEDKEELAVLFEDLETLPIIRQLRELKNTHPRQRTEEYVAYEGLNPARQKTRLTTGPLAGSSGVAAQRVFVIHDEDREQAIGCFNFVNFGPATCGWPDVVHGGVITTVLDETLGRLAIRNSKSRAAVTASLDVTFKDTTAPGPWYCIMAFLDPQPSTTDRKTWVSAYMTCVGDDSTIDSLQDPETQHVHVIAKGLFVVPKTTQLEPVPDRF